MKKKYYRESDRLEKWKLEITSRPVLEEMQKVKQLNMNGQTEESFERWRNEWDEIVTDVLPDLEELLFDAEEYTDKYRFKKARVVQIEIEDILFDTEEKIKQLLSELEELVGSEEKNRTEIEKLKEIYRESKKMLLAHRHSFGKSEKYLEQKLDEATSKFAQYDEKTTNGNYLDAREIVLSLSGILEGIKKDMEMIPDFLVDCHSTIPSQLSQLKDGYNEMKEQGYILDHIQVEKEVERITKELSVTLEHVEKAELDGVSEHINEWKETIDELYDLLEKEVLAKGKIYQTDHEILEMLQTAKEDNLALKNEIYQIQQSYHLEDVDLKNTDQLEKRVNELFRRFELVEHKVNGNTAAFSHLTDELLAVKDLLAKIIQEQSVFLEKLQALRKDELSAREKVIELKKKLKEAIRLVSNSNIPGVSLDYTYLVEDAQESIQNVIKKLQERPLNIPVVQKYLEVAVLTAEKVIKTTDELIETAKLVEKVIQYGNRYRSRYPAVHRGLDEAEQSFRAYHYKEALEQAATSIEAVEPGVLKKIETLL